MDNKATLKSHRKQNLQFITTSIESLKSNDEMMVLNTLYDLSSTLSIASDSIAEDPSCQGLIKVLIELFDKFDLPDISMNAIVCINLLLDINPLFTTSIVKSGGIPKIVMMTQNIEYIDVAEYSIKAIEKISMENPFVLLENDAFASILNIIDFFELGSKKIALKACVNMSRGINNVEFIKKFILPAIPSISGLVKVNGNSEVEKFILDQSILCFHNIVFSIKSYNLLKNDPDIFSSLIQYGILDNLFDVLSIFLKLMNDNTNAAVGKNLNINVDTFKNILKVLEILCSQSNEISNLVLNMNILEIINIILFQELGISEQKSKLTSSNISIFSEIFGLLISFFPPLPTKNNQNESKLKTKIISDHNRNYYLYFSEKILSILVKNIVNMPSTSTILEVIRLIELFVSFSNKEMIIIYIDPVVLSNISSKLLDSKDTTYITKILNLVEIIMNTCPETFIECFIREGVIENIKSITKSEENQFYISETASNLTSKIPQFNSSYLKSNYSKKYFDSNDGDSVKDENLYDDELANDYDDEEDYIHEKLQMLQDKELLSAQMKEKEIEMFLRENIELEKSKDKTNETEKIDETKKTANSKLDPKLTNLFNSVKSIFTGKQDTLEKIEEKKSENLSQVEQNIEKLKRRKYEILKEMNSISKHKASGEFQHNSQTNDQMFPKLEKSQNSIISVLKARAKTIIDTYFETENLEKYLKLSKCVSNPQEIFNRLSDISKEFEKNKLVPENLLNQVLEFLMSKKSKLTFFEIEKSEVILNFARYLDANYIGNLENFNEKNPQIIKTPHPEFFAKIRKIIEIIKNSNLSVDELISTLQLSISSMNCFKLYLSEIGNSKTLSSLFMNSSRQNLKIKIQFSVVKSNLEIEDKFVDKKLKELIDFYAKQKNVYLILDQNESFVGIEDGLFNKAYPQADYLQSFKSSEFTRKDVELTEQSILQNSRTKEKSGTNEKKNEEKVETVESKEIEPEINLSEHFTLKFFIQAKEEKFLIDKSWSLIDLYREIKTKFKQQDLFSCPINFEFEHKKVAKIDEINNSKQPDFDLVILNSILENINDIEEREFMKHYSLNIVGNKALYGIKRASPFIYFISLFELCLNQFNYLFEFSDKIPENLLENTKVSTLLTKQVRDPYAISTMSVPSWCQEITQNYTYLASFNSRYLYFKTCSFDTKRSMLNLSIFLKNFLGENVTDEKLIASANSKKKVKIDRYNLLPCVEKIYKEIGNYNGYLEIEYLNEVGTGNGPTLEFYSLFSKLVRELSQIWYPTSDYSLFPKPIPGDISKEYTNIMTLFGYVVARGLYDDRLLDFPINSLFWDLALNRPIPLKSVEKIDKNLSKALSEFEKISSKKQELLSLGKTVSEENLLYNESKIKDIDIYFTFPGINKIELIPNGNEVLVTEKNVEEYLKCIYECLFGEKMREFINNFRQGFNRVFDINYLRCFSSQELEEIICGSSNAPWDYSTLLENIIPNHGYDKTSSQYHALLSVLVKMNNIERKQFLLFVTGSPRLPLGGFKSLSPKLTVVKKTADLGNDNPDSVLPTVMTCQNYLKIPEYSSEQIFKEKLFTAMKEGGNTFYLS